MPGLALAAVLLALGALAPGPAALAQAQPNAPYTVLTRDARRPLAVRTIGGQEMVSLDELARLFDVTVREDALAGGLTVSTKAQTIVLTPGQPLASVAGRLVSLPAAPQREGQAWYVPVDFVSRALGPALGTRLEVRRAARLILSGDVRVPRITGRAEQAGSQLRLTLDVTPATAHTVTQAAGTLVVKLDADALDATLPASPMPDLVQAIRTADTGVALIVELGPRFASFRASDAPGERGAGRILIDIAPATTDAPAAPAAPATPPAPAAPAPADPLLGIAPAGSIRTIVIDPGHGGDEPGARAAQGAAEKEVTLAVARRLKGAIEGRLGSRVILTRDGDQTVGLDERAAVANNNKADLFISLHANASIRPSVSGAEVFYLSLADYGDQALRAARAGRETLPVYSGGSRDIEVILWEMAQAHHIQQSTAFAGIVEAALRERIPMSARALQDAPFRVLVGANMPAVLVEMGFMTNPEQAKQLASDTFQASIVQALVEAIVRFRDARASAPTPPPPASPAPGARD